MRKIVHYFRANFFRDRLILVSAVIAISVNIIQWIWLAGKFGYSQERIPLHFNLAAGIDYVGQAWQIYQIPALGLIIFVINLWLARAIYEKEKLFSYFLIIASGVVQIILLVAVLALLNLIF